MAELQLLEKADGKADAGLLKRLLELVIEMEDYADIAAYPGSASREQLVSVAGCYTRVLHDLRTVLGLED